MFENILRMTPLVFLILLSYFILSSRFLYPGIVVLVASSVSFPLGLGRFMAGDLNTHDQVKITFASTSVLQVIT